MFKIQLHNNIYFKLNSGDKTMKRRIKIQCSGVKLEAELNDSPTSCDVFDNLPLEGKANIWGDEIYFPISVQQGLDDTSTEVVELGTIGYWPPGSAFCIFFGPTPASRNSKEIRAASAVNVMGSIIGNSRELKKVSYGASIKIEKVT